MMHKKAVVDISLLQAGGLILAIVLIIGTITFFARLTGLFTGSSIERATQVSFKTLALKINELDVTKKNCAATEHGHNVFIGAEYAIVGFNKDIGGVMNGCYEELVERPLRPDCPPDKACICLYKTRDSFRHLPPLACTALSADYLFMPIYGYTTHYGVHDERITQNMIAPTREQKPTGAFEHILKNYPPTTNLFIFGSCNKNTFTTDPNFDTQRVYLEKRKFPEGTVIFIAHHDNLMNERYATCT